MTVRISGLSASFSICGLTSDCGSGDVSRPGGCHAHLQVLRPSHECYSSQWAWSEGR